MQDKTETQFSPAVPPLSEAKLSECDNGRIGKRPWLASILLTRGQKIWQRFIRFYKILCTLPRQLRRLLNKKMALTVANVALIMALSGTPLYANNIAVTTANHGILDDGECSLVEAIITANDSTSGDPFGDDCADGNPLGADTINLSGNVYQIDYAFDATYGPTGLPTISSDVTIMGNGATFQGIQPVTRGIVVPEYFRLMAVGEESNLTLNHVTLTGGYAADVPMRGPVGGSANGGAIYGYKHLIGNYYQLQCDFGQYGHQSWRRRGFVRV